MRRGCSRPSCVQRGSPAGVPARTQAPSAFKYAASPSSTWPIARRTGQWVHTGQITVESTSATAPPAAKRSASRSGSPDDLAEATAATMQSMVPRLCAAAPSARKSVTENAIAVRKRTATRGIRAVVSLAATSRLPNKVNASSTRARARREPPGSVSVPSQPPSAIHASSGRW